MAKQNQNLSGTNSGAHSASLQPLLRAVFDFNFLCFYLHDKSRFLELFMVAAALEARGLTSKKLIREDVSQRSKGKHQIFCFLLIFPLLIFIDVLP